MNMDSWTVNQRLGLIAWLIGSGILVLVTITMVVSITANHHGEPLPVPTVCDVQGHIVQPVNLDTAAANAKLDDLRLQVRLGRLPWARAAVLDKAEGCP